MGYNNNLTQNQNEFQLAARNSFDINSSVNIENSPMNLFHRPIEERIEPYNSKLLLMPATNGSPYCHNSSKAKSVMNKTI